MKWNVRNWFSMNQFPTFHKMSGIELVWTNSWLFMKCQELTIIVILKEICDFFTYLVSFPKLYRNANPIMLICRDGKFPTRHSRHFPIPHSWLSSCGKIKIPHSRLRRSWGIFISPRLLSHSWEEWNVPFVIHEKIYFSPLVASPLEGKNPVPISPH